MPDLEELRNQLKQPKRRKKPTARAQEQILDAQKNRCFYCGMVFGAWFHYQNFARCVELQWDHFVPYSYGFNNNNQNFVAACRQCNSIKSSHLFDTIQELIDYVRDKRKDRGLPLRAVWGDHATKTLMAEVLLANLSDHILLEETRDSPEEVIANCREWRRLHKLLKRRQEKEDMLKAKTEKIAG